MKRLGILTACTLLLWVLLLYPATLVWGDAVIVQSVAAALICLVPGLVTMLWAQWGLRSTPEQQLAAILGGTGLRMAVALGSGLALFYGFPETFTEVFWIWLLVFYLTVLALEIALLVGAQPRAAKNGE